MFIAQDFFKPNSSSTQIQKPHLDGQNGFGAWGGYMAAKKSKLEHQFKENAAAEAVDGRPRGLFEGVGIYVNGYTGNNFYWFSGDTSRHSI